MIKLLRERLELEKQKAPSCGDIPPESGPDPATASTNASVATQSLDDIGRLKEQLRLAQEKNDLFMRQAEQLKSESEQLAQQLSQAQQLNNKLAQDIEYLRKALGLVERELYTPSSERMVDTVQSDTGQLGLFNEAETLVHISTEQELAEPTEESLVVKVRKPRGKNLTNVADLDVEEVRLELTQEEQECAHCECALHVVGEEVISRKLHVTPPRYFVRHIIQVKYGCRHCAVHEVTRPPVVVPAPRQPFGGMPSLLLWRTS